MEEFSNCPACHESLIGNKIPESERHLFGASNFKLEIGLEYPEIYDGIVAWQCPHCNHVWPRFKWIKLEDIESL